MDEIEKIVDFVLKYSIYKSREVIKKIIQQHLEYKTCDWAFDKDGEIIFVCRWNVNGVTAYVLDFILNPKYRNRGTRIFKWVLVRNLPRFPYIRFLKWDRELKDKRQRFYSIKEMLKEE